MEGNGRMGMDKRKYMIMKICIFLIVFLAALVALFPFYWMFVTAVKPVEEIFEFPPKLWPGELTGRRNLPFSAELFCRMLSP